MNARPLAWLLALLALAPAARAEEPGTWFHGDLHAHVSPPDLPREVWASFFLPQDRACVIEYLAGSPERVPDETARVNLAAFAAALQAVN